nr:MAG TPA: hypothetical protein [Caudoviricetes sp.]
MMLPCPGVPPFPYETAGHRGRLRTHGTGGTRWDTRQNPPVNPKGVETIIEILNKSGKILHPCAVPQCPTVPAIPPGTGCKSGTQGQQSSITNKEM